MLVVFIASASIASRPCFEAPRLPPVVDASSGVRKRLRAKTRPPQPLQRALSEPLQLEVAAAMTTKRKVYLITHSPYVSDTLSDAHRRTHYWDEMMSQTSSYLLQNSLRWIFEAFLRARSSSLNDHLRTTSRQAVTNSSA